MKKTHKKNNIKMTICDVVIVYCRYTDCAYAFTLNKYYFSIIQALNPTWGLYSVLIYVTDLIWQNETEFAF